MKSRTAKAALAGGALMTLMLVAQRAVPGDGPENGNGPGSERYSLLTQITPANIHALGVAWVYDVGSSGRSYQATPLVVNSVMYVTTPAEQVLALNADSGEMNWQYDPHETRVRVNRGVSYWPGDATHAPRIVLATSGDGRLIEL